MFEIVPRLNTDPEFLLFCEKLDEAQDALEPKRKALGIRSKKDLDRISDVLFLQQDGKSVGCIALIQKTPDTVIICRVYVDGCLRGMGMAQKLIEEAEIVAKQKGAKFAVARILNKNIASLRAFEKQGYTIDTITDDLCDMRVYVKKVL